MKINPINVTLPKGYEKKERTVNLCCFRLLCYYNSLDTLVKQRQKKTKPVVETIKKNFISLNNDMTIPTLDNCKTINKKLQRFLQQQIEYSRLTPEELEKAGK